MPAGYYLVRAGDTLSEIAAERRVDASDLIRWNRLKAPYTVYAGKLLRVARPDRRPVQTAQGPGKGSGPRKAASAGLGSKATPTPRQSTPPAAPGSRAQASGVAWAWPLDGAIRQGFRDSDRTRQGLRIACREGDSVGAAGGGSVVYAGSGLKGYGNLIIVKHNENYLSAYGFNRRLLVTEGDNVQRGQTIAVCGQGANGAYLLHFEIRRQGMAVDPTQYLPPRT